MYSIPHIGTNTCFYYLGTTTNSQRDQEIVTPSTSHATAVPIQVAHNEEVRDGTYVFFKYNF